MIKVRFRVRTIFLVTLIVTVPIAHYSWHRQAEIAELHFLRALENTNSFAGYSDSPSALSDSRFDLGWAPCGLPRSVCLAMCGRNHHIIMLDVGPGIQSDEIEALVDLPNLQGIIVRCNVGQIEQYFTRLRNVRYLCLHGANVTNQTTQFVGRMENLRQLRLGHTGISDEWIDDLARLDQLEGLDVHGTSISDMGMARLRRLLPRCRITD